MTISSRTSGTTGSKIPIGPTKTGKPTNTEKEQKSKKSSNNRVVADNSRVATKIKKPLSRLTSSIPQIGLQKRSTSTGIKKPNQKTTATTANSQTMSTNDAIDKIKKAGTRKTINEIVSNFKQSLPKKLSSEQREQLVGKVEKAESERAVTLCCYNILVGCKMLTPNKNQELTGFKYSEDGKSHDFLYALDVFLFGSKTKKPMVTSSKNGDITLHNIDKEKQLFTNHGISKNTKKPGGIEVAQNTRKPIKNKAGTRTLSKNQAQNALDYLIKNSGNTTTGKQSYKIGDYQLALVSLNAFLQATEKAAEPKADPVDLEVLGKKLKVDIENAVEEAARAKAVKETVANLVDETVRIEEEQPPMQATMKRMLDHRHQVTFTPAPAVHMATLKTAPIEAKTVRSSIETQTASTEALKKATKQIASTVLETEAAIKPNLAGVKADFEKAATALKGVTEKAKADKLAAEKAAAKKAEAAKLAKLEKSKSAEATKQEISEILGVDKTAFVTVEDVTSLLHQQIVNIVKDDLVKKLVMEPIMANHKARMGMKDFIIKADKLENASEHCKYCIAAAQYLNDNEESVQREFNRGVDIDKIAAKVEKHMATVDLSKVVYTPAQQGTRSWLDGYYGV